jgi:hypothetical protein
MMNSGATMMNSGANSGANELTVKLNVVLPLVGGGLVNCTETPTYVEVSDGQTLPLTQWLVGC